ncbi:hypothetical protein JCM10207_004409 [Rhodosporidiobolus poonsookiae]
MPSIEPRRLITVDVDTPLEQILEVMRRDGGVVIKNFMTKEQVDRINAVAYPISRGTRPSRTLRAFQSWISTFTLRCHTTHIRGMFGKMPLETASIMMHPLWNGIMENCLQTTSQNWIGDRLRTTKTGYMLSVASAYHVAPGAEAQLLHRDDAGHCVPTQEGSLYTSQMGCLVAGTNSTERNGATRVIPGSHLWGIDKMPRPELTVPAVMSKGSTLFWLGSVYHGAGANVCTPGETDDIRLLYGVFACQDQFRTEEAIAFITPTDAVRDLPMEVLVRAGYAKSPGGLGNINTRHPYERWDDIVR